MLRRKREERVTEGMARPEKGRKNNFSGWISSKTKKTESNRERNRKAGGEPKKEKKETGLVDTCNKEKAADPSRGERKKHCSSLCFGGRKVTSQNAMTTQKKKKREKETARGNTYEGRRGEVDVS